MALHQPCHAIVDHLMLSQVPPGKSFKKNSMTQPYLGKVCMYYIAKHVFIGSNSRENIVSQSVYIMYNVSIFLMVVLKIIKTANYQL